MNVNEILDKVISAEDKALVIKTRVSKTVGEAVKLLQASASADLGPTEKAVLTRTLEAAQKLQQLIG